MYKGKRQNRGGFASWRVLFGVCGRLVAVLVGVCRAAEGDEEVVGDVVGHVAHMVEEGAETFLGDLALVGGEGLDLVVPGAVAAVDGEVLGLGVVVEEVPVVLGGFDVDFYFLVALVHIDLGLHIDGDAHGFVADADEADLAFAVESEDGVVLPADVVEEHGGEHGVGHLVELSCGAVDGVGGGALVGSEVVHHSVAHFGAGGAADGHEAELVLEVVGEGVDDGGVDGEGESEDGGEMVFVVAADADGGGAVGVEGGLGAATGEVDGAFAFDDAVGGGEGEVGFDDAVGVGDLGFGAYHVLFAVAEVGEDAVCGEEFVVGHFLVGEEGGMGAEGALVHEDGGCDAVALPVGG